MVIKITKVILIQSEIDHIDRSNGFQMLSYSWQLGFRPFSIRKKKLYRLVRPTHNS